VLLFLHFLFFSYQGFNFRSEFSIKLTDVEKKAALLAGIEPDHQPVVTFLPAMDELLLEQCISLAFALTYQAHIAVLGSDPFAGFFGIDNLDGLFQRLPGPGAEKDAAGTVDLVDADDAAP